MAQRCVLSQQRVYSFLAYLVLQRRAAGFEVKLVSDRLHKALDPHRPPVQRLVIQIREALGESREARVHDGRYPDGGYLRGGNLHQRKQIAVRRPAGVELGERRGRSTL
eukprot:scaffold24_cov245-Pinguiococcus_pyrenoidosus.AAC.6